MEPSARVWIFAFSFSLGVHAAGIAALALMPRNAPPGVHLPDGSAAGIHVAFLSLESVEHPVAEIDHESTASETLDADDLPDDQPEESALALNDVSAVDPAEWDAAQQVMAEHDSALPEMSVSVEVDPAAANTLRLMTSPRELLNEIEERWRDAMRMAGDVRQRLDAAVHRIGMMAQAAPASGGSAGATPAGNSGAKSAGVSQGPSPLATNRPPDYPEEARRRKEAGTVVVQVIVLPDGLVSQATILHSSGFDSLDRAALVAVRSWRFAPAVANGSPVQCEATVPIEFVLRM